MRATFILIASLIVLQTFSQTSWEEQASCPGAPRWGVVCFAINGIGYMVSGRSGTTDLDEVWAYDALSDSWSERTPIPGGRRVACAFTIGGKGYVLGGLYGSSNIRDDLWEYDPASDTWTQMSGLPGTPRYGSTAFVQNGIAYVLGGSIGGGDGPFISELWAYDPSTDEWASRAPIPDQGRVGASSFTANNLCYVFGGRQEDQSMSNELWAYLPGSNTWEAREPLPGAGRHYARAYSILDRGVILSGQTGTGSLADGWVYSPWSDSWWPIEDYPGEGGWSGAQFALNERLFAGLGQTSGSSYADLWELKEIPIGHSEHITAQEFDVYPSLITAGGLLNIRTAFTIDRAKALTLTDVQGRRVPIPLRRNDLNSFEVPDIAPGTYLLTIPLLGAPHRSARIMVIP